MKSYTVYRLPSQYLTLVWANSFEELSYIVGVLIGKRLNVYAVQPKVAVLIEKDVSKFSCFWLCRESDNEYKIKEKGGK